MHLIESTNLAALVTAALTAPDQTAGTLHTAHGTTTAAPSANALMTSGLWVL